MHAWGDERGKKIWREGRRGRHWEREKNGGGKEEKGRNLPLLTLTRLHARHRSEGRGKKPPTPPPYVSKCRWEGRGKDGAGREGGKERRALRRCPSHATNIVFVAQERVVGNERKRFLIFYLFIYLNKSLLDDFHSDKFPKNWKFFNFLIKIILFNKIHDKLYS